MKFIVNECTGSAVAQHLRAAGHDVVAMAEIMGQAEDRTILEHLFRDLNRRNPRKTANNSMQRLLKTMLADTPLVKNLDNPDYMDSHAGR